MNMLLREMRMGLKQMLIWCAGMAALLATGMGKYAGMSGNIDQLNTYMVVVPAPIRSLMGLNDFNLGEALGFYGVMFTFLLLIAGVHAAMQGAGALVSEERDRTAEFLLVKPVSRLRVLAVKLLAAFIQAMALNLVTWAVSAAALSSYYPGGGYAGGLAGLMGSLLLFQLVFLAIGVAVAALIRKPERAAAMASGALMAAFLCTLVAGLTGALGFLNHLTPFGVFAARHVLNEGGLSVWAFAYAVLICAAAAALALRLYPRRDILL